MIEKLQFLPHEKWWSETPDSLYGKLELMIRKLNETIDVVNSLASMHARAKTRGIDTDGGENK
jgi:hypothetical protein